MVGCNVPFAAMETPEAAGATQYPYLQQVRAVDDSQAAQPLRGGGDNQPQQPRAPPDVEGPEHAAAPDDRVQVPVTDPDAVEVEDFEGAEVDEVVAEIDLGPA